ncbi:MAG TPA: hypothetical protein VNA20_09175 [Frankiaceae bacterium]|nr:hypothetical protein [Frankiaceae bacterium]
MTGTADASRGNGLPDMVDQLSALGGRLELLSGTAAVTARGGRRWSSGERALGFPGTLLQGVAIVGP